MPPQSDETKPTAAPKAAEAVHKPRNRPRASKPRRPKLELAPVRETDEATSADEAEDDGDDQFGVGPVDKAPADKANPGKDDPNANLVEDLPFVEQPY